MGYHSLNQIIRNYTMDIDDKIIKLAAMGVGLSKKYDHFMQEVYKIAESESVKIIPFYKDNGTKMPAGYVIETEGQVIVSYHGTKFSKFYSDGGKEIYHDLQTKPKSMNFGNGEKYDIHEGFKKEYETSKDSLYTALSLVDPKKEVVFSGHSLGGAVAQVAAFDAKLSDKVKIGGVITFGAPAVFPEKTAEKYCETKLDEITFRVEQTLDIVPRLFSHLKQVGKSIKGNAGSWFIHAGSAYREMVFKIGENEIRNAKFSRTSLKARMKEANSAESYIEEVGSWPKFTFFSSLSRSIKQSFLNKKMPETKHIELTRIRKKGQIKSISI